MAARIATARYGAGRDDAGKLSLFFRLAEPELRGLIIGFDIAPGSRVLDAGYWGAKIGAYLTAAEARRLRELTYPNSAGRSPSRARMLSSGCIQPADRFVRIHFNGPVRGTL